MRRMLAISSFFIASWNPSAKAETKPNVLLICLDHRDHLIGTDCDQLISFLKEKSTDDGIQACTDRINLTVLRNLTIETYEDKISEVEAPDVVIITGHGDIVDDVNHIAIEPEKTLPQLEFLEALKKNLPADTAPNVTFFIGTCHADNPLIPQSANYGFACRRDELSFGLSSLTTCTPDKSVLELVCNKQGVANAMDKNKDNKIDATELQNYFSSRTEPFEGRGRIDAEKIDKQLANLSRDTWLKNDIARINNVLPDRVELGPVKDCRIYELNCPDTKSIESPCADTAFHYCTESVDDFLHQCSQQKGITATRNGESWDFAYDYRRTKREWKGCTIDSSKFTTELRFTYQIKGCFSCSKTFTSPVIRQGFSLPYSHIE